MKKVIFLILILISLSTSCVFGYPDNSNKNSNSTPTTFALVITNKCDWDVSIQFLPVNNNSNTYYPFRLLKKGQTWWFKPDIIKQNETYNIYIKPDPENASNKLKYCSLGTYSFSEKTVKQLYYDTKKKNYYFK